MNISQISSIRKTKNNARWLLPVLFLSAIILAALSLCIGSAQVSLFDAITALFSSKFEDTSFKIIFQIRAPRVLGALLAGSALSLSGVIIQAVLGNPMASPNLIGVNAGAGFFAIIAMAIFPSLIGVIPLFAFLGALFASLLIYAISSVTRGGKTTVILVGVAIGSILTAGINGIKTLFPDSVYDVSGFLIGGLSNINFKGVIFAATFIIPAAVLAIFFSRRLDVLSLGDSVAGGLGLSVRTSRLFFLSIASLLAGAAISFAGLIGFVGLIVPHVMRRLVGGSHRHLVPASILGGGAFLLACDLISRTLFSPYELPVGILLSLIGGPFFIILILRGRRSDK